MAIRAQVETQGVINSPTNKEIGGYRLVLTDTKNSTLTYGVNSQGLEGLVIDNLPPATYSGEVFTLDTNGNVIDSIVSENEITVSVEISKLSKLTLV